MTHPQLDLSAQCSCGAVTLTLKGRVRSMLLCSCLDCQKAGGTGHSAVAMAASSDVHVTGPLKTFSRPANSGATFTRHFCPQCGTPVYGISSRAAEAMLLPAGLFAGDNSWFAPNQLIFARSHLAWDTIDPTLPAYDTYRPKGALP